MPFVYLLNAYIHMQPPLTPLPCLMKTITLVHISITTTYINFVSYYELYWVGFTKYEFSPSFTLVLKMQINSDSCSVFPLSRHMSLLINNNLLAANAICPVTETNITANENNITTLTSPGYNGTSGSYAR